MVGGESGIAVVRGTTSNIFTVAIRNSTVTTGAFVTGLTNASTNLTIEMRRAFSATKTTYSGANIQTITTLGTFAAPTASTQIRFKETDMLGDYEIQVHNSATNGFGSEDASPYVDVKIYEATTTALNIRPVLMRIPLTSTMTTTDIWTYNTGAGRTLSSSLNLMTSSNVLKVDANGRTELDSAGIDQVLVESGITAGAGLTDDAATQLTSINARQSLALLLSAVGGVLSGLPGTSITVKQTAKSSGSSRIVATVDSSNNRSAFTLKVPT